VIDDVAEAVEVDEVVDVGAVEVTEVATSVPKEGKFTPFRIIDRPAE
jgi:hypothetical protein